MIKFIDIETGNVFDGSKPYIHWYDEGQSVNLIYSKELYIVSDKDILTVTIPNTGVFDLLDTAKVNAATQAIINNQISVYTYEIYDNMYMKIDRLPEQDKQTVCGDLIEDDEYIQIYSDGADYNGYYVHKIYFIAKSAEAGEFRENFYIYNESGNEGIECTIAADFYNEDERLGIALKNFGMEAPSLIQRAIYEGNVHEEFPDNILINRKWKELLINYQDCLMNKGSYKSLINCLEWFGYGDAIRLTEYWRDAWNTGLLYEQDIKDTIYNITRELLRSNAKTTYIGILLALQKVDPGNYDEYESVPEIVQRGNLIYSTADLCLKMTLLGNFFSTYFMPIHLDLIHCSVENIVYSTTLKILSEGENKVVAYNDSNEELKVTIDSKYKIMDVQTHVYVGPEFQQNREVEYATVAHRIVNEDISTFGFELTYKDYTFQNEWQAAQYGEQLYGGPGCAVQFKCDIPNYENTSDFLITSIMFQFILNNDSPQIEYFQTNISVNETPSIVFNYLFKSFGDYIVDIQMFSNIGKEYSKRVRFTIDENVYNGMQIKKIERIPAKTLYYTADFTKKNGLSVYGSYSLTDTMTNDEGKYIYSQYIYTGNDPKLLGMNSFIAIQLEGNSETQELYGGDLNIKIKRNETGKYIHYESCYEENGYNNLISQLNQYFSWYLWFIRWAYTGEYETLQTSDPETQESERRPTIKPYLVGVRKVFTNNLQEFPASSTILSEHNLYRYYGYANNRGKEEKVEYRLNIKYLYYSSYIKADYILYKNNTIVESQNGSINIQYSDYKFNITTYDDNISINWIDTADKYDRYDYYGIDKNKIKEIEKVILNPSQEPNEPQYISLTQRQVQLFNEDRFVPIFHRLADIEDDMIHIDESFIVIPQLNYMKEIIKDNQEQPLWTFHNATTGEDFVSENYQSQLVNITQPILSNFSPLRITPGYYDVILNMRLWDNYNEDEYQQHKVESMIKVEP